MLKPHFSPLQECSYDKRREEMRAHIQTVYDESQRRFGATKIAAILSERGIKTSHTYVAELMREMRIQSIRMGSKQEYKKRLKTMDKQNILQQQFKVTAPNLVWASDVTCLKLKDTYYYICVVIASFSRRIIAHGISENSTTYLITSTFKRAFENRNKPNALTFHSDRGVQCTSQAFRRLLYLNKVVQSFSKSGSPHDNAVAEAFFASMKREELYRRNYTSLQDLQDSVNEYVEFYNHKRPHGTLAYTTPARFEAVYTEKTSLSESIQGGSELMNI